MKGREPYDGSRFLLVDDEPEHLDWLVDYLRAEGYATTIVTNVKSAVEAIQTCRYRAYLIDLNIPLGGWAPPSVLAPGTTYDDYHGFYVIRLVRSQGNAGIRVVAYSAHQNERIISEVKRLYCRYVAKGRPRELKDEVDEVLKKDPLADRDTARANAKPRRSSRGR